MALQLRLSLGLTIELYTYVMFLLKITTTWAPANARSPPLPVAGGSIKHDAEFEPCCTAYPRVLDASRRLFSQNCRNSCEQEVSVSDVGRIDVHAAANQARPLSIVCQQRGAYSFNFQRRGNGFRSPLNHLRGGLLWTNKRRRRPLSWAHFHVFLLPRRRARSL